MASIYPSIPDPGNSPATQSAALKALKQSVELLVASATGVKNAAGVGANTQIFALASQVDVLIAQEQAARVSGDTNALNSISSTAQQIQDQVNSLNAEVSSLQSQVISSVNELSSQIDTAQSDINTLQSEATTLFSDVSSINSSITNINSDITSIQVDISDVQGEVASAQSQIASATSELSSISTTVTSLQSSVSANSAAITTEAGARATADTALSGQITTLTSTVNSNTAAISDEAITRASADTALSGYITTLNASVASNSSAISSEATARASADSALSSRIDNVVAVAGEGTTAAVDAEATARAAADSALATQITTVSAQASAQRAFTQSSAPSSTGRIVGDLWFDTANGYHPYFWNGTAWIDNSDNRFATIAASVSTETAARVSADNALSATITSLTSTVNGNTSAITSEAATRASADSTLAGQITTVSAQASAQRVFRQSTAPTSTGRLVGDLWYDTGNGNKPSYWTGSAWSDTTDVRITDNAAAITTESTARANADSSLASTISTVSAQASAQRVFVQSTSPTTTGRIVGDLWYDSSAGNKPYYWTGTTWSDATDNRITVNAAAITTESTARVNADNSLAAQITTVSSQATAQRVFVQSTQPSGTGRISGDLWYDSGNGNKPYYWNGTAWTDATDTRVTSNSAAITNEAATRASADTALAANISTVSAQASAQRVFSQSTQPSSTGRIVGDIWIDTSNSNKYMYWNGTIWSDVTDGRITANAAAITTETNARVNADNALTSQITTLTSSVNTNASNITSEASTRASADSALGTRIDNLTTTVNTNTASISNEASTRATADTALSGQITTVSSQVAQVKSFSQSTAPSSTGRTPGDMWYDTAHSNAPYVWNGSAWVDGSNIPVAVNTASITSEAVTRASADSALGVRIDNLTTTVNNNTSSITSEATTRANADTALSNQITTVSAQAAAVKSFSQATAPSSTGRTIGDMWYDTGHSNAPYVWNGTAWVDGSNIPVAVNAAAITTEATTRASNDTAISNSVTTLTSTVNGHTSSISSQSTAIANLGATYTVNVTSDGKVAGIQLASSGVSGSASSAFNVLADQFNVYKSGYGSKPVFSIQNVNGVSSLALDGTVLADTTVGSAALVPNSVSYNVVVQGGNSIAGSLVARNNSVILINASYNGSTQTGNTYGSIGVFTGWYVVNVWFANGVQSAPTTVLIPDANGYSGIWGRCSYTTCNALYFPGMVSASNAYVSNFMAWGPSFAAPNTVYGTGYIQPGDVAGLVNVSGNGYMTIAVQVLDYFTNRNGSTVPILLTGGALRFIATELSK